MSTHKTDSFINKNGAHIFTRQWTVENPVAGLLISHGIGEHSGRYEHVAEFFTAKGMSVFALDHQGHGQSEGKRGHINSFVTFAQDLETLRQRAAAELGNKPIVLFGHSMGALIVFEYLLNFPDNTAAAVLSAPPLAVQVNPAAWQKALLPVMKKLAPSLTLDNGIDAAWLSKDKTVVQAYRDDPLVHSKISVTLYLEMTKSGERCLNAADRISQPTLLLIAGEDKIIDEQALHQAFEQFTNPQKKKMIFKDDFHEIHNEPDQATEFEAIWQWLNSLPALNAR